MFRRRGSIKLFEVAGIRIGVDGTWFFMLFLLIFLLSGSFRDALHSSDGVAYMTTVATVLLFFGSLILHELGHAFEARRQGIEVTNIELFLFGGLTAMSREAATPGEEFKVAAAGPAGTLLFVLICVAIDLAIVGPSRLVHAVKLDGTVPITPVLLSLSWLVPMNLLILFFNLVPAFPLDGGKIARAVVWRLTGDRTRGTQVSAQLGQGFAVLLAGFGIWLLVRVSSFTGLWLLAIAFMIWQSAKAALAQSALGARIDAVRVADIMDAEPISVPIDTPLTAAEDEYLRRYGADWLPVIDESGHFAGIVRAEAVGRAIHAGQTWLTVASCLEPESAGAGMHIDVGRPLSELLSLEALGRLGAVVVLDEERRLRGIVTLEQVRRAFQSAMTQAPQA